MTLILAVMGGLSLLSCKTSPQNSNSDGGKDKLLNSAIPSSIPPVLINEKNLVQTFAFGSCSDQNKPQPIWRKILEAKPDFFIALGDNVYSSKASDRPFAKAYQALAANSEYSNFRALVPILATWDDHDYGGNDFGFENPDKVESRQAFLDFFPNARAKAPESGEGIYQAWILGPPGRRLQVILLDARWFRSPLEEAEPLPGQKGLRYKASDDPGKTMLGETQWEWLANELRKSADLRLIVNGTQILPDDHGFEKWANFPRERQRLLSLVEKAGIKKTLFISGDRHFSEFLELPSPKGKFVEISASSLNSPNPHPEEKSRLRLGSTIRVANFGLAKIDWQKRNLLLSVVDKDGKTQRSLKKSF